MCDGVDSTPSSRDYFLPDTSSDSDADGEASIECRPPSATRGVVGGEPAPSHPVWDSTTPAYPEVDRRRRASSVPAEQPFSSPSLGTVVVGPCRHSGVWWTCRRGRPLPADLWHSLVEVSRLFRARGFMSNNQKLVQDASSFEAVHKDRWRDWSPAAAGRTGPSVLAFTRDVQTLHAYLTQEQDKWLTVLSESPSPQVWKELAEVCLVQLLLLNQLREGEVASMPLSALQDRGSSGPHQDLDWALSQVERTLYRCFTRVVVRRQRRLQVPVLPPRVMAAVEVLVACRDAGGVLDGNKYLFTRPGTMTQLPGPECLLSVAKRCGAACPRALTSTRLRKHAATLSTVLSVADTDAEQLDIVLGHHAGVHTEWEGLPEQTLQLAMVSKLLEALELGRGAGLRGRTLGEVDIHPDDWSLTSPALHPSW